jgi:imidazolonepropionase-like amidohydrolase
MVVIDGSAIVGVDFGVAAPADADVHDLAGATLLPGLVDTHVHLCLDATDSPVDNLAARDDDEVLAAMVAAARVAALGGVTTVRDLGDRDFGSLQLRGRSELPTILSAGPPITMAGGHCHFLGGAVAAGEDGVREGVRRRVERGVDVIKVMASGGVLTPGTRQEDAQFSVSELRAIVDEAHKHGLPVTAHAHAAPGVANAVAAGVDGLEHATFWTAEGVDAPPHVMAAIVDQRIVVGATAGLAPPPPGTVADPPPEVLARLPHVIANLRRLWASGAVVVAGTDAGIGPTKPHDVLRYAPPMMHAGVGMSPAQALQIITAEAARVLGLGAVKGRLATGYDADILAVRGDPTSDLGALHTIEAVYVRGSRAR